MTWSKREKGTGSRNS